MLPCFRALIWKSGTGRHRVLPRSNRDCSLSIPVTGITGNTKRVCILFQPLPRLLPPTLPAAFYKAACSHFIRLLAVNATCTTFPWLAASRPRSLTSSYQLLLAQLPPRGPSIGPNAGALHQSDLQQLDRMLADSIRHMQYRGCRPPYIAYGHYPLTTIAYPGQRAARAPVVRAAAGGTTALDLEGPGPAELKEGLQQHQGEMRGGSGEGRREASEDGRQVQDGSEVEAARTHRSLESVLLKHGVSAYLSGE